MTDIATHDDYLAAAPEQFRPVLSALRDQLARLLPDAEEVIEHRMPGFRLQGGIVASYAAFSKQCGLYLAPGTLAALQEEIVTPGFKPTKTGITFPASRPLPEDLLERLVRASREDLGA